MTRNESSALIEVLRNIKKNGSPVVTRGFEQTEVLSDLQIVERPYERVIVLKHRNNNIFALIAETLWVLGGRNDMEFLEHYLPRAIDFSDDGKKWRAGYGPRLRNWYGVDQFKEVAKLINHDPSTKRAVMIIYDPAKDHVKTKDVPCNNWLHFMARDGKLHMNVCVRANDAIWGFGGINTFEWSVLHEMMAFWTGNQVGNLSWFTGTIHVYSRHYNKMDRILESFNGKTLYDFDFVGPRFSTSIDQFDDVMETVFDLESRMRVRPELNLLDRINQIEDRFIQQCLHLLFIYNWYLSGSSVATLKSLVQQLPQYDFKVAAIEYFARSYHDNNLFELRGREQDFFDYYWEPSVARVQA